MGGDQHALGDVEPKDGAVGARSERALLELILLGVDACLGHIDARLSFADLVFWLQCLDFSVLGLFGRDLGSERVDQGTLGIHFVFVGEVLSFQTFEALEI